MYRDATVDEMLNFLLMVRQDHGGQTKIVCEWDSGYSMLNDYAVKDGVLIFDVSGWGSSNIECDWESSPDCDQMMRPYMCDECGANPSEKSGYRCSGCLAYKDHQK